MKKLFLLIRLFFILSILVFNRNAVAEQPSGNVLNSIDFGDLKKYFDSIQLLENTGGSVLFKAYAAKGVNIYAGNPTHLDKIDKIDCTESNNISISYLDYCYGVKFYDAMDVQIKENNSVSLVKIKQINASPYKMIRQFDKVTIEIDFGNMARKNSINVKRIKIEPITAESSSTEPGSTGENDAKAGNP